VSEIAASLDRIAAGQERLSHAISRLERRTSSNVLGCLSSPRDPKLLEKVVQFYQGRRCCLSGVLDSGPGGGLDTTDHVIAAHIIPMTQLGAIRGINASAGRQKLTANDPKDVLLLQKKWEILFDHHCWCLVPKNPMSSTPPEFCVKVFAPKDIDEADLSLMTEAHSTAAGSDAVTADSLRTWIRELHAHADKIVSFQPNAVPSYRALSWHAQITVDNAVAFRWIESDDAFVPYADLSPFLSPRNDFDEPRLLAVTKRGRPEDDEERREQREKRFATGPNSRGSQSSGPGSVDARL
jgi:HNH endonuclease